MTDAIGVCEPIEGVVYLPKERLKRYVEAGELPTTSLVDALRRSFAAHRERIAIYSEDRDITYGELDRLSDNIAANLLARGMHPLDRALFQSANSPELLIAVIGCLKAGIIPVCSLAAHREHEISYLGRHTSARAHFVQGDDPKFDYRTFARKMRASLPEMALLISLQDSGGDDAITLDALMDSPPADAMARVHQFRHDPFQVAFFQLSGGTSGVPKVIPRAQNEYLLLASRGAEILGMNQHDVVFMPMPMMHNAAMGCIWLSLLLSGAAFAIPSDMTPESWGAIFRKADPTFVGMIRALMPRYDAMLDRGLAAPGRVRLYWTPDAARLAREKYGVLAVGMFGMTEGMCMYPRLDSPVEAMDWTVGTPLSSFDEIRLVEEGGDRVVDFGEIGEMEVRGPYTLAGYFNAPERNAEAFTADGFYKTGDLLRQRVIDGQAYYEFAGRTRDIVDRGHEKVNCEEIENAVSTHGSIGGCAVVGMPDPVLGERICAYLIVRDGHATPDVAQLGEHMAKLGFAKIKWPERVELIESFPLTKVGKLDKAVLRADIAAKLQNERGTLT